MTTLHDRERRGPGALKILCTVRLDGHALPNNDISEPIIIENLHYGNMSGVTL